LFSGDLLLPGRLTLEDTGADKKSIARVIEYLAGRPVVHILGGHIERDTAGHTYAEGSTYHPNERVLELSRQDLLTLPVALDTFNGFYASHENYSITHPMHSLLALLFTVLTLLIVVALAVRRLLRRRRQLG
jgi:hydroxyacylglutathione hydrolase